jgi:hypothetical protein
MHSGRSQKSGFTAPCRTIIAASAKIGACTSPFDSMGEDFRLPPIPGRRQTNQAGLRGTKIPCLQTPYNSQHFPFGNLPVADESAERLRQLKIIHAYPEKAGAKMTASSHSCRSLLFGVFSDSSQIQDAASMANPEV